MDSTPHKTRSSTRQRKPTWKKREEDAFILILIEELPIDPEPFLTDPIPHFDPPLRVTFESMRSQLSIDDPLRLFLALFGEESLDVIVDATNAKADSLTPDIPSPRPRPWTPISRNELIIYLGTLIYMGRHYEFNREYYWNPDKHRMLAGSMAKTRWEQITRFLSLHPGESDNRPWFEKLDPLITIIRNRIASAVFPATWLAVDEMMVQFQGRSSHTVKMKNKPIKEGFKI
jgi:Transposase IS4